MKDRAGVAMCTGAFLIYAGLGLAKFYALGMNAFDLSVLDYAMWSSVSGGGLGHVPLIGYSLFSQHFMPTLLLLAPLSLVFSSPAYLVVLQTAFYALAGWVFFRFADRHLSRRVALALLAAFLLSRRSHSAVTSYFYIESAEPMLIFGAVLAWSRGQWWRYAACTLLAIGCKEDVAGYFLMFGLLLAVSTTDRRLGIATVAFSAAWIAIAMLVVIPHFRAADGLSGANEFLDGRFGLEAGGLSVAERLLSVAALPKLATVLRATAFTCLLAPGWFLVALPGVAMNLAAVPGSEQNGLVNHYLWPILPWLFVAAVFGARKMPERWAQRWTPLAIAVISLIDTQLPRSIIKAPWKDWPQSRAVLSQLHAIAPAGEIVAQESLIPHMPRTQHIRGVAAYATNRLEPDYVLLTAIGDTWPFDETDLARGVSELQSDPRYEQLTNGPLFAFRRR